MHKIVLATTNPGKIKDYQNLIQGFPIQIIPQSELSVPEVEETGLTFVENALIKARHASKYTGLPALGDDSGLVVDALKGAPGLYSARYAGKGASANDNIQKLLQDLAQFPDTSRRARFYTVIVLLHYYEDPAPILCEGTWEGEILHAPRGQQGFGYLPIFYLPSHQCSAAEISIDEKNKISHRSQAFNALIEKYLAKNV